MDEQELPRLYVSSYIRYLSKKYWHPRKEKVACEVIIGVIVEHDGKLKEAHIEKSSGDQEADEAALNAVREASKRFPPFPFKKDSLNVELRFQYNVFIHKVS